MPYDYLAPDVKAFSEALLEVQCGLRDSLNEVPDHVRPWIRAALDALQVTQRALQVADQHRRRASGKKVQASG